MGAMLDSVTELTEDMQRAIDDAVEQNHDYLVTSLALDIEQRLQATDWTTQNIQEALRGFDGRIRLYTQAFWTTIWQGLQMVNPEARIGWRLSPLALEHCDDCVEWEGDYDSWEEMLDVTGGLPGYSDSVCGPGCLCEVIILE